MSDNKKYYYLKLNDKFFDSEEMKVLESQVNGMKYQNLYLKLCLLSLKSGGRLIFKDCIPYDIQMLSTVLRVDMDTVKTGVEIFERMKLIDIMPTGVIYMLDIQSLIGHGSSEGDRKKIYRENIEKERIGTLSRACPVLRPPEIELEKEIELEIEKDQESKREGDRSPASVKKFVKPSVSEVQQYLICKNISTFTAEQFFDYYESKGWRVGNSSMKSWTAAANTWAHRNKSGTKEPQKLFRNRDPFLESLPEEMLNSMTRNKTLEIGHDK